MSQQSSRGNPGLGDILRTVVVMGGLVLVIWTIGQIFTITPDTPVRALDLDTTVSSSQQAVQFDLLAPEELPEGWIVTSARPTPDTWHLGVLTAEEEYVGLGQARESEQEAALGVDEAATPDGEVRIGGETWSVWDTSDTRTLTREDGGVTAVVSGSAPAEQIDAYVASLSSP